MQFQACCHNFFRSLNVSKCATSCQDSQNIIQNEECVVLEDNVVYPMPDHLSSVDFARQLIEHQDFNGRDEPFFVVDLSRVLAQHQIWLQNLPRVTPYYAVKCNNHKVLLRLLASLGCNFDCASKGEIESILDLGVSPDRIIYANPCKTASYIKHAAEKQVRAMTFDNEQELYKIAKLYPQAELVLRIAVSDPTAVCPLNLKFGCEPDETAPALLKLAASLNMNVIGVSFHVGSGCRDPTAFAIGIAYARSLFNVGLKLGLNMHVVDLGGGYPGYKTELAFETICDTINRALDLHFPQNDHPYVRFIAEPGRFYAAACFTLCCTVVARTKVSADRVTKNAEDRDDVGFMYYINDGVYGSFNCILYDHVHPTGLPLNFSAKDAAVYPSAVWGPTCDSLDLVQANILLPELFEGQWMVFENMGAYTAAAGSEFNGFPRPTYCYVVSQSDHAILNALCCPSNPVSSTPHLFPKSAVGKIGHRAELDDDCASVTSGTTNCSSSSTSGFETDADISQTFP